jgi:hypothetical protein
MIPKVGVTLQIYLIPIFRKSLVGASFPKVAPSLLAINWMVTIGLNSKFGVVQLILVQVSDC